MKSEFEWNEIAWRIVEFQFKVAACTWEKLTALNGFWWL